jgi:hypothetical protein
MILHCRSTDLMLSFPVIAYYGEAAQFSEVAVLRKGAFQHIGSARLPLSVPSQAKSQLPNGKGVDMFIEATTLWPPGTSDTKSGSGTPCEVGIPALVFAEASRPS